MSKQPTTNELLEDVSSKLDKILRLLAVVTVKDLEKEQQKIELLDSIGFKPSEIGKFLNKTPENVSVVLNRIRKESKQKSTEKAESTSAKTEKSQ